MGRRFTGPEGQEAEGAAGAGPGARRRGADSSPRRLPSLARGASAIRSSCSQSRRECAGAEILSLTKAQVDLEKGRIVLHRTKNGERRTVPLAGRALELLKPLVEARGANDALLFPGHGSRKPVGLNRAWDKALKRAAIENFRFHDLRHCAASYLLEDGASLGQIAEVLGHKTLQMVKRYSHLGESKSAQIVGQMNARIFRLAGEKRAGQSEQLATTLDGIA